MYIVLVGAKEFGKRRRRQDIAMVDVDLVCHRARDGRHFGVHVVDHFYNSNGNPRVDGDMLF